MDPLKQRIFEKLTHTYCRLRPSKIEGVGVFAVRDIPQGINPFVGREEGDSRLFSPEELRSLPIEVQGLIKDFFVTDEQGHVDIPEYGLNGMDLAFFVNHSDNPNLETHDESVTFVTKRMIQKGEELTADYKLYDHRDGTNPL